jgi:hypothetical protein
MTDPQLREYAQRENDYLLAMLLKPNAIETGEKPLELAKRNCEATAHVFGQSDPLHIMALNTFAFVQLYTNEDPRAASESALKAVHLAEGCREDGEMLLEAQCLAAWAQSKADGSASKAVLQVLPSSSADTGLHSTASGDASLEAAARLLNDLLRASVYERRLQRLLLMITLRDLAVALLEELHGEKPVPAAAELERNLQAFLQTYYSRARST